MTTIRCIVPMPTDCLMAPSLPRTWPLNTTILETAQSGSTMQGEKLRRLLTKIHLFIEVPMLLPLPSSKHSIIQQLHLFIVCWFLIRKSGFHQRIINETFLKVDEEEILAVGYEDGEWHKPYYDCGGGNIWMMTYTVPFFGYDTNQKQYFFK